MNEGNDTRDTSERPSTATDGSLVVEHTRCPNCPVCYPPKPLTCVEWRFPLGGSDARLSITAHEGCEIVPEDMDALQEIAALIKGQLARRLK